MTRTFYISDATKDDIVKRTACQTCGGRGLLDVETDERGLQIGAQESFCPNCGGSGADYPPETVRSISMHFAAALAPFRSEMKVRELVALCDVLDTLSEAP